MDTTTPETMSQPLDGDAASPDAFDDDSWVESPPAADSSAVGVRD